MRDAKGALLAPLLLLVLAGSAGRATDAAEPLDWLTGRWAGSGTIHGAPSRATLNVTPVLQNRFVQLDYTLDTGTGARAFRFEGRALYHRSKDGSWSGHWFDSTGMVRPIRATATGAMLDSAWGDAATEAGRTIYRQMREGRIETIDSVRARDDGWREFARHSYGRVSVK